MTVRPAPGGALERLRKQYFSLYPLFQLQLPTPGHLAANQGYLISCILDDPALSRYAPEANHQKSFWRRIVQALEIGVEEVAADDQDAVGSTS